MPLPHNRFTVREGRGFDRQPCPQPHVARSVQSVAGSLLRVAKNRVIEVAGFQSGALDRAFASDRTQLLRSEVLQLAAVAPKRRAGTADDRDVTRFEHESQLSE